MSSSKQVLYKDLGKRLSDLLTKEFPSEKQENKIEWKGTTANNVTFETSILTKKDGSVLGTFTPKYKTVYNGVLTSFLAELNTKKEFKGEVAFEDAFVGGLKTVLTGQSNNDDVFGTVGVEYRHDVGSFNATADYGKSKGSTVKGGFVFGSQGFTVGASGEYFIGLTEDSDLKEFTARVGYSASDFDAAAFGRLDGRGDEDKNELGASYFHRINSDLAVGTEVTFDTANAEVKPRLVFGTQYKFQNETTLKGKFDTTGKLGLAFIQKMGKNATLNVASTIDTNNLSGKAASTFGFTLTLSD